MPGEALLYVEDEETDVLLLQFALEKAQISNPLKTVTDGDEAVGYLSGRGKYADREHHPLPGLVLLDLNLPRLPGMKVLQWIREQPHFSNLPVVIYTSSEAAREQEKAKQLGANDYIVKANSIEKIALTLQKLKQRWLLHS